MRQTRQPKHPGVILKTLYLDPLEISVTKFAETIQVSRKAISAIVNQRKSVTPEMAVRFSIALGTTPNVWSNLQANFDLWKAKHELQEKHINIEELVAV